MLRRCVTTIHIPCNPYKKHYFAYMFSRVKSDVMICDPDFYWSNALQQKIKTNTSLLANQWIYNIASAHDEEILLETDDWLLAKDKHPGSDLRFLIIFKDTSLRTIRDLRSEHIMMLVSSMEQTRKYLIQNINSVGVGNKWSFFFHYYPSVFQLHAHVMCRPLSRNLDRIHEFKHIVRNLSANSSWYQNALVLTKPSRILDFAGTKNKHMCRQSNWWKFSMSLLRIELKGLQPDPVKTNTHLSVEQVASP
jgi:diadenosine tetraphosphate (Ap4A) HIT family hydrolase